jgi:hypothetical protein
LVGNLRTELLVLVAAVAFVHRIACANLADLLLARSASQQRGVPDPLIAAFVMYATVVTMLFHQLLGGKCGDGGHAGSTLSEKFGNHGPSVTAGV